MGKVLTGGRPLSHKNNRERPLRRLFTFTFITIFLFVVFFTPDQILSCIRAGHRAVPNHDIDRITQTVSIYTDHPIQPPYEGQFGEVGERLGQVARWLSDLDRLSDSNPTRPYLISAIETVATSLVPFLNHDASETPLSDLRSSFEPGSRGIVIPVGGGETAIRFAGHLITSLRLVLGCELPIQIAYAGDDDLSKQDRQRIASLEDARDVSFLDVLSVLDDSTLKLEGSGWAIKPFAALVSKFEQVIVLDVDTVFVQKPEALFEQYAFIQHGALLFHDQLMWQHSSRKRHDWFKDQMGELSRGMPNSLEECDSGVIVLDKSRPEVLTSVLHIAWQNTLDVRDEVTYKLLYNHKEAWWLGLEFVGSGYGFEARYGSVIGWEEISHGDDGLESRVCGSTVAHVDDYDNLMWYSGSLLKNKLADAKDYDIPEAWMMGGKWHKGATTSDMSCMSGEHMTILSKRERKTLELSIEAARRVDQALAG